MVLGGWVHAKKAVGHVNWRLLLLIGSALGLSKGVVNSGLASYVGSAIRNSGMSADCSLFVICAFTMVSQASVIFSVCAGPFWYLHRRSGNPSFPCSQSALTCLRYGRLERSMKFLPHGT